MALPDTDAAVNFIITGFSRFSGVEENPTESLVTWLSRQSESGGLHLGPSAQVHSTAVLRVAAKDVDLFFQRLANELALVRARNEEGAEAPEDTAHFPHADGTSAAPVSDADAVNTAPALVEAPVAKAPQPPRGKVVLLHLGVANTAEEYRLEARAYNCASFRVPDERGWQPQSEELEGDMGLDSWVGSQLPLEALREVLASKGHNVMVSEDAGRYVCNWTYYRACRLSELGCATGAQLHAVFVHVPPFAVCAEEQQRAFLLDAVKAIAEHLCSAG